MSETGPAPSLVIDWNSSPVFNMKVVVAHDDTFKL